MENAAAVTIFTTKDKLERKCDKLFCLWSPENVIWRTMTSFLRTMTSFLHLQIVVKKVGEIVVKKANAISRRILLRFVFIGGNLKEICQISKRSYLKDE